MLLPLPRHSRPDGHPSPGDRPDLTLLAIWVAFIAAGFVTAVWALARSLGL